MKKATEFGKRYAEAIKGTGKTTNDIKARQIAYIAFKEAKKEYDKKAPDRLNKRLEEEAELAKTKDERIKAKKERKAAKKKAKQAVEADKLKAVETNEEKKVEEPPAVPPEKNMDEASGGQIKI